MLRAMNWCELARAAVPSLRSTAHKGQAGRIGVVGGSLEYTGAPYFAAISAQKVGADLVHVFCTKQAAPVIKSYSPELIVHPLLDIENDIREIESWLERIHVLVIGPGLGRDEKVLHNVSNIIKHCRETKKPLVIDADGLYLITREIDLIKDYPFPGIILTPNAIEFARLYEVIKSPEAVCDDIIQIDFKKLGKNIVILRKGATDRTFSADPEAQWLNNKGGSGRRCGGQGDLLSGSAATFFHWCLENLEIGESAKFAAAASYAASVLTRDCNERAFAIKGRSVVCSDMIEKIHEAFDANFERKN